MSPTNRFYDSSIFDGELFTPLVMTKSPVFLARAYNACNVIERNKLLLHYDNLRNEHGNTLFLIKVGSFEYVTKLLQENNVIYIVDDCYRPGFFGHFHTKKISKLILLVMGNINIFSIRVPRSSSSIENPRWNLNEWCSKTAIIRRLERDVIETVIPNFPLECKYTPEPIKLPDIYKWQGGFLKCGYPTKNNLI